MVFRYTGVVRHFQNKYFFEQALLDKTVFVFHTYSIADEEMDKNLDTAVFTTKFVLEDNKTITFVSHEIEDGAWQFFSDDNYNDYLVDIKVVGLNEIFEIDPTLIDLIDMEPGYFATRKSKEDKWSIKKR